MGVTKTKSGWRARWYQGGVAINVGSYKTKRQAQEALAKFVYIDESPAKYTKTPVTVGRPRKSTFLERIKRALKIG